MTYVIFLGNECDVEMESSEDADYADEWVRSFPALPLLSPHTPDHEDKLTVHQIISKRFALL